MRLTQKTDYALRVLMHLAVAGRPASVPQIAARFTLSEHHLTKVVQALAAAGWVTTQRGRGGGVALAVEPRTLRVGDVVSELEPDFRLVECFEPGSGSCAIENACALQGVLEDALALFLGRLDGVTLADLTENRRELGQLLQIDGAAPN